MVVVYLCSAPVFFPSRSWSRYVCSSLNPCSSGGIEREPHFDSLQPQSSLARFAQIVAHVGQVGVIVVVANAIVKSLWQSVECRLIE